MDFLKIENVTKRFGNFTALKQIDLNVQKGEFVCLLGPSGCGKTTLLRVIAGLEEPSIGSKVMIEGKDITNLPPAKRDFGIVFQSYALFPNLTAFQNVAYGLKNKKLPKQQIKDKVMESLALVNLDHLHNRYPSQLSGGQQQRIALARALAISPSFLLLDEPLSALDAKVRIKLRMEIRNLQEKLGITTIMVTHDQEEALSMGDKIAVMNNASLEQLGSPQEIYEKPITPFVADFIGTVNTFKGVAIRPEHVKLHTEPKKSTLAATVDTMEFRGSSYRLFLNITNAAEDHFDKDTLIADLTTSEMNRLQIQKGRELFAEMPEKHVITYKEQEDEKTTVQPIAANFK